MGELLMPSLGADMDAGTVIEWLVNQGDLVHRGDIVAVVDTDKADVDIETFESGTVDEILVPLGLRVPVGTPLARLAGAATMPAAPAAPEPAAPEASPAPVAPKPTAIAPVSARPIPPAGDTHSPLVRRLARHLGVDLAGLSGTGPGGTVTRDDVENAAKATSAPSPAPAAATGRAGDQSLAMRRAIAKLMSRSAREIPHYHLATQIDLSTALAWLEAANLERPVTDRLLPAALLLKATALAARRVPDLNGFWIDDEFHPAPNVHLGVAIALRTGGLVAPAIHDADAKDLGMLMRDLRDLVGRTRNGHLRSSEMADPTITVTSLGDNGVEVVHGLIYPPQVALVGFGTIVERPWASGGMVGARRVVTATLAADHRASDGIRGARLLDQIDRLLQDPSVW